VGKKGMKIESLTAIRCPAVQHNLCRGALGTPELVCAVVDSGASC